MRQVVWWSAVDAQAASHKRDGAVRDRGTLALAFENRAALADLVTANGSTAPHGPQRAEVIVLDMDSSVSPTMVIQEARLERAFDCTAYHPTFLFNQFGMLERCTLAMATSNVLTAGQECSILSSPICQARTFMRLLPCRRRLCDPCDLRAARKDGLFLHHPVASNAVLQREDRGSA